MRSGSVRTVRPGLSRGMRSNADAGRAGTYRCSCGGTAEAAFTNKERAAILEKAKEEKQAEIKRTREEIAQELDLNPRTIDSYFKEIGIKSKTKIKEMEK